MTGRPAGPSSRGEVLSKRDSLNSAWVVSSAPGPHLLSRKVAHPLSFLVQAVKCVLCIQRADTMSFYRLGALLPGRYLVASGEQWTKAGYRRESASEGRSVVHFVMSPMGDASSPRRQYFFRESSRVGPADRLRTSGCPVVWTAYERADPVLPDEHDVAGVVSHALSRQPYISSMPLRRLRLGLATQTIRTSPPDAPHLIVYRSLLLRQQRLAPPGKRLRASAPGHPSPFDRATNPRSGGRRTQEPGKKGCSVVVSEWPQASHSSSPARRMS